MTGECRLRGEAHRIPIHVVARRDDIGNGDGALGLEHVLVERWMLHHVAQQLDRRRRVTGRHRDRPAEALRRREAGDAPAEHLSLLGDLQRGSCRRLLQRGTHGERGETAE